MTIVEGQKTHLPVEVHVAEFVGQFLKVIRLEPVGLVDDVEVSGPHGALAHALRDQEEVIPAHKHIISACQAQTVDFSIYINQ